MAPANMALDHYVSQVHLKNFYSPALKGLMYAIRKSDLKRFQTRSQDVCRIEAGSTNSYLMEDRAVEEFLKEVEPHYNSSIIKLVENKMDVKSVASLAGFAAYIVACSPAAMRLHSGPLKAQAESVAAILDRQGMIPKAPTGALDGKTISELLSDGTVSIMVDPKFPQAVSISNILHYTSAFGNSPWEILHNCEADSPFFTSDYPAAIEVFNMSTPINRIVPLTPTLAIRIIPDIRVPRKPDLSFAKFRAVQRRLKHAEIVEINRLIVRCAEDTIFYRDDHAWIEGFIERNRRYRIEPVTHKLRDGTGDLLASTHRVLASDHAAMPRNRNPRNPP